jgi:hypothetical protein
VVLAALAVGDRTTALDAASRYLAVVNSDHPEMRQLMAVEQAVEGDMPAAVASAEYAAAGRPGDVDGPVREINDELQSRGQSAIASRFLADGYQRTGRAVYGDLLAAALPWRLRHRNRILIAGLGMMLVGIGLAVGLASGVGFILLLILGVGGALVMAGSALMRAPGANHAQTQSIVQAHVLYRSRLGKSDVLLPAIGSGAGFFAWITMMNRGDRDSVPPAVLLGLAGASVAVGAVVALVVWQVRRRRRRASAGPEPVPGDRCRCWEIDLAGGPQWERYLTEHLEKVATDEALGTVLRRCPTTDKMWLHVPSRSLAVSVHLPDEPEPEPDYPVGHYL